ncbi:hypothetical protein ACC698_38320, partial [Rhizobium johnstonii]
MKTISVVIASLIAFSGIGHAAYVTAPVKEIMEATRSNWADNISDWTDVFDAPGSGVAMAMYNLDESIREFASASMMYG